MLARLGCEVIAPERQVCCGAVLDRAGDPDAALGLARRNVEAFEGLDVDAVVFSAAGCGAAMKEYGRLLRRDPRWAGGAGRFSALVRDVLEFVAERDFAHGLGRVEATVTLQDACRPVRAQDEGDAPRRILRSIPGIELREPDAPFRCCGASGLCAPALHGDLPRAALEDIAAAGVIATASAGCTMRIEAGLRASGSAAEAVHAIELLDRSYAARDAERAVSAGAARRAEAW